MRIRSLLPTLSAAIRIVTPRMISPTMRTTPKPTTTSAQRSVVCQSPWVMPSSSALATHHGIAMYAVCSATEAARPTAIRRPSWRTHQRSSALLS